MLIPASTLPAGETLDCDLCIVGAGPAGMTIAHRLRDRGLSIIVLDSGLEEFEERASRLNEGESTGLEYQPLDAARLRMFGGSSNHWEGSCNDLDNIDFGNRPWVPDGGWPIAKEDLRPYYARAHTYLQLGEYDYDLASWGRRLGVQIPKWFDAGLEGAVTHHSPPTRFGEVYGPDLAKSASIKVILGATALQFGLSDGRQSARSLSVADLDGRRFELTARRFVLAMGGIENSRFLLLSNLGNDRDLVGRYFMEHPYFRLSLLAPSPSFVANYGRLEKELESGPVRITPSIKFSESYLLKNQFQNCRIAFEPADRYETSTGIESFHELPRTASGSEFFFHLGNLLLDVDMIAEAASRRAGGRSIVPRAAERSLITIGCMAEQLPNRDSRVTLAEAKDTNGQRKTRLDLSFTPGDKEGAGRFASALARAFGAAGLGRVRPFIPDRFAPWPPRRISWGSHHMGTTRMSETAANGVVDANLKIHGVSNVYVAGSSVFPTGGHVPPTLTIVALSLRLADHLLTGAP